MRLMTDHPSVKYLRQPQRLLKAATTLPILCLLLLGSPSYGVQSLKEIREAGVIIQNWDTSCGAAAMATVFTYHFNDPSTEREVAQATGFKDLSFDDLRYFDGPIVPVNFHGYNHYVVYKGLTAEGKVWLADPAYGNRIVSRERFERYWMEGMAFTLLKNKI
jgi:predicted double-glycine peptidase